MLSSRLMKKSPEQKYDRLHQGRRDGREKAVLTHKWTTSEDVIGMELSK
jgi:hypothetical protein